MKLRRAFTLIELLVVIAIITMLAGMVVPSLYKAKEIAKRAACSANLKSLHNAMYMYAGEYKQYFPVCEPLASDGNCVGANLTVPRNPGENGSGNSRSLFLLVRMRGITTTAPADQPGYVAPQVFLCPGDLNAIKPSWTTTALAANRDFADYRNLSYSYQVQKSRAGAYYPTSALTPGAVAILADRNPMSGTSTDWATYAGGGRAATPTISRYTGNSYNHSRRGQVVLYASASANWTVNPQAGSNGDNIWTPDVAGGPTAANVTDGAPQHEFDSFLWP